MLKTKWLCYKTYFSGFNISPGLNHIGIKLGFQPRCTFVLQKNYSNTIYFWCKDQQEKYFFKDFYFLWQKKKKKSQIYHWGKINNSMPELEKQPYSLGKWTPHSILIGDPIARYSSPSSFFWYHTNPDILFGTFVVF